MIADKKYINTRNPFCPRPNPRYLWFKNQTVTQILDKQDMRGAILDEVSVTGYTHRHHHLSPTNERVAHRRRRCRRRKHSGQGCSLATGGFNRTHRRANVESVSESQDVVHREWVHEDAIRKSGVSCLVSRVSRLPD
jgi:hypothetical protein